MRSHILQPAAANWKAGLCLWRIYRPALLQGLTCAVCRQWGQLYCTQAIIIFAELTGHQVKALSIHTSAAWRKVSVRKASRKARWSADPLAYFGLLHMLEVRSRKREKRQVNEGRGVAPIGRYRYSQLKLEAIFCSEQQERERERVQK